MARNRIPLFAICLALAGNIVSRANAQELPFIVPVTVADGTACSAIPWPGGWSVRAPVATDLVVAGATCDTGAARRFGALDPNALVVTCNYSAGMTALQCSAAGESNEPASTYAPPPPPPPEVFVPPAQPVCWPSAIGGTGTWPSWSVMGYVRGSGPYAMGWHCPTEAGWRWYCVANSPDMPDADDGVLRVQGVRDGQTATTAWDATSWRARTAAEQSLCDTLRLANRPPDPAWVVAAVAVGSDRPVYACDSACLANRQRGSSVGRSGPELVAECEGPISPPWLSGSSGNQWQFTTATNGQRGVAVCAQGP